VKENLEVAMRSKKHTNQTTKLKNKACQTIKPLLHKAAEEEIPYGMSNQTHYMGIRK
jgi:hypothetical protein